MPWPGRSSDQRNCGPAASIREQRTLREEGGRPHRRGRAGAHHGAGRCSRGSDKLGWRPWRSSVFVETTVGSGCSCSAGQHGRASPLLARPRPTASCGSSSGGWCRWLMGSNGRWRRAQVRRRRSTVGHRREQGLPTGAASTRTSRALHHGAPPSIRARPGPPGSRREHNHGHHSARARVRPGIPAGAASTGTGRVLHRGAPPSVRARPGAPSGHREHGHGHHSARARAWPGLPADTTSTSAASRPGLG